MSGLVCLRERTEAADGLPERVGSDAHVWVGGGAAHVRGASAGGGIEAAAGGGIEGGIEAAGLEAHRYGHTAGAEWGDGKRSAPQYVEFGRHGLGVRKRAWRQRSSGIVDVRGVVAQAGEAGVGLGRNDGGVAVGAEDAAAEVEALDGEEVQGAVEGRLGVEELLFERQVRSARTSAPGWRRRSGASDLSSAPLRLSIHHQLGLPNKGLRSNDLRV